MKYGDVELNVTGPTDPLTFLEPKVFFYHPVPGFELEISAYDSQVVQLRSGTFILECTDSLSSDLEQWLAWGSAKPDEPPASAFRKPITSSEPLMIEPDHQFKAPVTQSGEIAAIWAPNWGKYAWFKATPYASQAPSKTPTGNESSLCLQ